MDTPQLRELTDQVFETTAAAVQSGPFHGMTIIKDSSWYGGNLLQKLLGIYEQELHASVEAAIAFAPELVVNIGSAEGYYAVGLALRLPAAVVHVFDTDPRALKVCELAAVANRAEARLRLECSCNAARLRTMLARHERSLLIVDCEGCEEELFDSLEPADLGRTVFIVEMHELLHPGSREKILERYGATHEINLVTQGARNPHEIPVLRALPEDLQWQAMSEGRPETMDWIVGTPRK
jgi:hypothetical protein